MFIENDAESLLRRLPQDILSTHYHDDERHIRALLEESGLCPCGGTALAAVRGLFLTVSHQDQIGQLYPQVLSLLVHGACRELFYQGKAAAMWLFQGISVRPFYPSILPDGQIPLPAKSQEGRKVRSWNVIVLLSHCPTPPDVFMIRRKLPRHKDAIYDR